MSGRIRVLCSYYHHPLRTSFIIDVDNFAVSSRTSFDLNVKTRKSRKDLICEYELCNLPSAQVSKIMVKLHYHSFSEPNICLARLEMELCPATNIFETR